MRHQTLVVTLAGLRHLYARLKLESVPAPYPLEIGENKRIKEAGAQPNMQELMAAIHEVQASGASVSASA